MSLSFSGNHGRRGRFRRLLMLLIVMSILVANGEAVKSQTPALPTAGPSDKQTRAAETVDRLRRKYYETLDFETIWKEGYVADAKLRSLEVEAIIFRYIAEAKEPVSHEAKERAYVAMKNFWHALSAAKFTAKDSQEQFQELDGPYEALSRKQRPFANERELDQDFTGGMNRLSTILRKYVVQSEFDSPEYKSRVARFIETRPAEANRIKEIFLPAGLSKTAQIYVVDRETFHYYMIEEQGDFKILTIVNRRL